MSWYDAIADEYSGWSGEIAGDIDFYARLAQAADGPIVELAVGDGRVAIPVARAIDRPVIGIDESSGMLARARERAEAADVDLDLRMGDMCDLTLDEPASLVYCPARALLHIPTWSARRRLFERVFDALRPGGRFAWNVFAFDHRVAVELDGAPLETPSPHVNRYSVADNRVDIELQTGEMTSLWWATKNECLGLIDVAGLELETIDGDFAGNPLRDDSTEYVFIARRP
ncbi:MAG: class I SAM-dependent methyltransferase [Actinomycetota bacterium]